jgi:hypothetical protein
MHKNAKPMLCVDMHNSAKQLCVPDAKIVQTFYSMMAMTTVLLVLTVNIFVP